MTKTKDDDGMMDITPSPEFMSAVGEVLGRDMNDANEIVGNLIKKAYARILAGGPTELMLASIVLAAGPTELRRIEEGGQWDPAWDRVQ